MVLVSDECHLVFSRLYVGRGGGDGGRRWGRDGVSGRRRAVEVAVSGPWGQCRSCCHCVASGIPAKHGLGVQTKSVVRLSGGVSSRVNVKMYNSISAQGNSEVTRWRFQGSEHRTFVVGHWDREVALGVRLDIRTSARGAAINGSY